MVEKKKSTDFDRAILALKKKGVMPEEYDTAKDTSLRGSVMFWWKERNKESHGTQTAEENIRWILKNPTAGENGETLAK